MDTLCELQILSDLTCVSNRTKFISEVVSRISDENKVLSDKVLKHEQLLNSSAQLLADCRKTSWELARRKLNLELAISHSYLEHRLNLKETVESLKFETTDFSFQIIKPIELLSSKNEASTCDVFGPDQFGVRAFAILKYYDDVFNLTLHFAFGFTFGNGIGRVYIARHPHLNDPTNSLIPFIKTTIEKNINEQLQLKLSKIKLSTEADALAESGKALVLTSSHVEKHTSIAGTLASIKPLPNQIQIPPISTLDEIPTWAHSTLRISSVLCLEIMQTEFEKEFDKTAGLMGIKHEEVFADIVIDPNDKNPVYANRKRVFVIRTKIYCFNDFDERKNYGTLEIYASLEARGGGPETPTEIYLNTFVDPSIARLVEVIGRFFGFKLPKPTILKLKDIEKVITTIHSDVVNINSRYILKE